jgi:hypothetical protein
VPFNVKYLQHSFVEDSFNTTKITFSPNALRSPAFFEAELNQPTLFREGILGFNSIIHSTFRFKPRSQEAYLLWLEKEQYELLAQFYFNNKTPGKVERQHIQNELDFIRHKEYKIMQPFYRQQKKYYDYCFKDDYHRQWIFDPMITIHPDELFFECFNHLQSSYVKLSCHFDLFKNVHSFKCGSTHIEYSLGLYKPFQKIRNYKRTFLSIDPNAFENNLTTMKSIESQINYSKNWMNDFLEITSAMMEPMLIFDLKPMDIYNICFILRRQKKKGSSHFMSFHLKPKHPIKIVFEPDKEKLICSRSIYSGNESIIITQNGARRLFVLERYIALAKNFKVHFLPSEKISFFEVDLGNMTFTLGLLNKDHKKILPDDKKTSIDSVMIEQVYLELEKHWFCSIDFLMTSIQLEPHLLLTALSLLIKEGRVIYDLRQHVYRIRELMP